MTVPNLYTLKSIQIIKSNFYQHPVIKLNTPITLDLETPSVPYSLPKTYRKYAELYRKKIFQQTTNKNF